jgi:hypothetical protein
VLRLVRLSLLLQQQQLSGNQTVVLSSIRWLLLLLLLLSWMISWSLLSWVGEEGSCIWL